MEYRPRLVDSRLDQLLGEHSAVMLSGPRAAGKTTTAARRASTIVRLDQPSEVGAFRSDPDAALRGLPEPVLLDEWHEVDQVLGAIKRSVDADTRPGRYLITGSSRGSLSADSWPLTGRAVRLALYGMIQREILGRVETRSWFDRVVDGDNLVVAEDPPDLRGYVEMAIRGGFPDVLTLSTAGAESWLESYLEQLVTRDAPSLMRIPDTARLRRYLSAYAASSAGIVTDETLIEGAGVDRKTADGYESLLKELFVVDTIPAWSSNRLKRLVRQPKRYFVEPALMCSVLRADVRTVMSDTDLLGRTIDTLVASQLRAELDVAQCRPVLYHLREQGGRHEIDLVAEIRGGRIIAIEVKSSASPDPSHGSHLGWLRDALGDRFVLGGVFHTGHRSFAMGDRIVALPIATLWAP